MPAAQRIKLTFGSPPLRNSTSNIEVSLGQVNQMIAQIIFIGFRCQSERPLSVAQRAWRMGANILVCPGSIHARTDRGQRIRLRSATREQCRNGNYHGGACIEWTFGHDVPPVFARSRFWSCQRCPLLDASSGDTFI
jgi:hypothetical protein